MNLMNKKLLFSCATAALLVMGGCSKDWTDINENPNSPVESNITPDLVLPNALLVTANRINTGFGFLGNWLGYWAPAANYAPNAEEQSYAITTNFQAGQFSGIMDNLFDYQFMENKASLEDAPQDIYKGIAKIMKALNFAMLVDMYNDIPYSTALKGIENIRPTYDAGQAVYEGIMNDITEGMTLIEDGSVSAAINFATADIMFHGDKDLWLRFANTLKLRLLIHQANKTGRQAYIDAELAKIRAEGSGFLESGQDAAVNPGAYNSSDRRNAFYATYGYTAVGTLATDFWRANIISVNYLKTNGDPRVFFLYRKIAQSVPGAAVEPFPQLDPKTVRGNQYGLAINNIAFPYQTFNYVSQVGGVTTPGPVGSSSVGLVKGFNQDAWIITSVESMFLQAEAIARGWDIGVAKDAKQAYKDAVLESFKWLNVNKNFSEVTGTPTAIFNAWYNAAEAADDDDISWDAATDKIALILYQKYLAMNGSNHLETWTDLRRATNAQPQTDPDPGSYADGERGSGPYPYLDLSQNSGRTSQIIPTRLLYPQRELNLNQANVPQEGRSSGDQYKKIWWMN